MRIDREGLRRRYASLSDEELLALDRAELTEVAQSCYDEEVARRGLTFDEDGGALDEMACSGIESADEYEGEDLEDEDEAEPAWLEEAACACSFAAHHGTPYAAELDRARAALRATGIPCRIVMAESPDAPSRSEYRLMVPGALILHAASVLDRDVFNAEHEKNWRSHFEALSDGELAALDPAIFCAGLLDRVARLKRAYQDEVARRKRMDR